MRQVAPARESAFLNDLKACRVEYSVPLGFATKCAGAGAFAPLQIVSPANKAIPPGRRDVFINHSQAIVTQDPPRFIHDYAEVLGVVQYVAQQDSVYRSVLNRKMSPVELPIINRRFSSCIQIDTYHLRADHCRQVVCDEAVAAANIKHPRVGRNHASDFERHVISTPHLATPPFAPPATPNAIHQYIRPGAQGVEESTVPRRNGIACIGS